MSSLGPSVVFDFDGSLTLARKLFAMADELDLLLRSRLDLASTALAHWSGEYADDFVERIDTEQSVGVQLVGQLRGEADGWAVEWQRAMDQENWNRYAAAVKRVEHDRSLVDSFVGFFAGHDDLPSQPAPAGVPVAPGFWPTRSFANYSRY